MRRGTARFSYPEAAQIREAVAGVWQGFLLLAGLAFFGWLIRLNAFARIGSGILYEIRPAVLLGMLRQDVNFHDKHPPAELGSRLPRTIAENSIPQALLCVCSRKSIHQDFRGPC